MNTQEFVLIPKSFYTDKNNSTSQVLKDPQLAQKAKALTLLQRNKQYPEAEENEKNISNENILSSIDMLNRSQKERSKEILKKIESSDIIGFNKEGKITINKTATTVPLSIFLYDLQQPRKTITDSTYRIILDHLKLDPSLVSNTSAKKVLQSHSPLPEIIQPKRRKQRERTPSDASNEEPETNIKKQTGSSKPWTFIS